MAGFNYTYSIISDLPNAAVASDRLLAEVRASIATVTHINTDEDTATCDVFFDGELTPEQKTSLDAIVGAHSGEPVLPAPTFYGSASLVPGEVSITQVEWISLGGVVTNPGFFDSLDTLRAKCTGMYKASGAGAQIRCMEDGVRSLGVLELPDSDDSWCKMEWVTTEPATEGSHEYTIEARLGGEATSVSVRYVSMSLLKLHT